MSPTDAVEELLDSISNEGVGDVDPSDDLQMAHRGQLAAVQVQVS